VKNAIATQQALEQVASLHKSLLFHCQNTVTLHHSRFAREDRRLLDQAVENAFGKSSHKPVILVATQTVEQSLDIDADLIFTDLCPIDVLLQRLGRLHRHQRLRPQGFEQAQAFVLTPQDRNLGCYLTKAKDGFGKDRAYSNILALEATWRLLEQHRVFTIPSMNRLLVERGTRNEGLRQIAKELDTNTGREWQNYYDNVLGKNASEKRIAYTNALDWGENFLDHRFDKDTKIGTRLGLEDFQIPFQTNTKSPFDKIIRSIVIPHWMGLEYLTKDEYAILQDDILHYGEQNLIYDRYGLRKEDV
jgi:CRISPR-associated endonuclease/helicase Cas3